MTSHRILRNVALLLVPSLLIPETAFASTKPLDAATAKAQIQERGIGSGVTVNLADKSEVSGMIVAIGEDNFTLRPKGASESKAIEYAQVTRLRNDKLSKGKKTAIVLGIVAAGVTTAVVIGYEQTKMKKGTPLFLAGRQVP